MDNSVDCLGHVTSSVLALATNFIEYFGIF
jgi:hypothetical protein